MPTDEFYLALGKMNYWYNEVRRYAMLDDPNMDEWLNAKDQWAHWRVATEKLKRELGIKYYYEVKNK